jgi:ankyrin repeat protein
LQPRTQICELWQTLAVAAANDKVDCLNALITARADLNAKGKDGLTPVAAAAKRGKIECLNVLIAAGADVNPIAKNEHETKPVVAAIRAGNIECLDALLAADADATAGCNFYGKTASMEACIYGRPDMLRLLIKSETDINAEDRWGRTALVYARHEEVPWRWGMPWHWRLPRADENKLRECVSVLETAAAAASAKMQLLTLHAADPNDDGSVSVLATSLGGDEVAQVQVDPSDTMGSVIAELQVELSPRERRFMSADGRLLERGTANTTLRDWLLSSAD